MIKYGKKLINVLKNDIAFFNELHFLTRQKKPLGEDYDKNFRPIFDEIIEKGDDGQRAFAREMNKGRICCAFAGGWTKKYKRSARIITDKSCGLNYTFYNTRSHGRKKLFFMKQWEKAFCRDYIRCLLMEQDVLSPHFYFTDTVMGALKNGGTMLDMGVAEGNFTLEFIDDADRVYMFEPDSDWHEPLKKTFAEYRDKIVLCDKFVSDKSSGNSVSVDEFFGDNIPEDIKLIKMDIEGYEQNALNGMKKTLEKNPDAVLLICVYHKQYAEDEIRYTLSQCGEYDIKVRDGYMFFSEDPELAFPYLRHGIIECRAIR